MPARELKHYGNSTTSHRNVASDTKWLRACLFPIIAAGIVLLASCGNGEEVSESTALISSSPTPIATPAAPDLGQTESDWPFLPCHIDLGAAKDSNTRASQDPVVVRIQMLEHPSRIVPNDIVLEQNRLYRIIVQAGSSWHTFKTAGLFDKDLNFELPPGGQAEELVRPLRPGVAEISDPRYILETPLNSTITVVPEGMTPTSWLPSCAKFSVRSPPVGAALSTPLVIQGTVERFTDYDLQIANIETWANGKRVASDVQVFSIPYEWYVDFIVTIPDLSAGNHTIVLVARLQNNAIAATATMPLTILPASSSSTVFPGYQGRIDLPNEGEMHSLPVTIEGWVVIPSSESGSGVGAIEIWNGTRESGQFLAEATYGMYRPDVAQALEHPPFVSSGFFAQLTDLPAGEIELNVYVRNRSSGEYESPRIGQSTLTRQVSLAEGKVAAAAWPVALAAAPDGRLFFAELLTGNIRVLVDGQVLSRPFATLADVSNYGESGLTGLALHPDFPRQPYVYAMYVVDDPETGLPLMQRIVRFRDNNSTGQDYAVVIDDLPATTTNQHNGGRIAFGSDGKLYVSIGDTDVPGLAQDSANYAGSILRYNPDGSIPIDNPSPNSAVFAIGFRNVFGFAFQPETGDLYATENGPGGFDEVNKVEAGKNYGWPDFMGVTNDSGIVDPIAVFGKWPQPAFAPTGAAFDPERKDLLLFCAYRAAGLHALQLRGSADASLESATLLSNNCALDVTYSDGWLYYSTISAIYRARLDDLLRLQEGGAN